MLGYDCGHDGALDASPARTSPVGRPTRRHVTLVEGSSFCISGRAGDIVPGHAPGPVLPRHPVPVRLRAAGQRRGARAAGRRRSPSRSARSFVGRTRPGAGQADSTLLVFRQPLHRPGHARGPRDPQLRRRAGVLLARAHRRRRLRRPVRGQGAARLDRPASDRRRRPTAPSSFRTGAAAPGGACDVAFGDGAGVADDACHLRGDRAGRRRRGRRASQVDADHRRRGDRAALPVRPARRAGDAGRAAGAGGGATSRGSRPTTPGCARCVRRSAEDLGVAAHLRPRVPRAGGGRRRRAVVHDAVRARLAAHRRGWRCSSIPTSPSACCRRWPGSRATKVDARTEEEPGRILHEMRFGDVGVAVARRRHVYYGTADATPLFVMLLGELRRWGLAPELGRPAAAARRPGAWRGSSDFGDRDGDGYVEYQRASDSLGTRGARGARGRGGGDRIGVRARRHVAHGG